MVHVMLVACRSPTCRCFSTFVTLVATRIGPTYSDSLVPLVIVPPKIIALSVSALKYISLFDGGSTTPSGSYTAVFVTSFKTVPVSVPTYVTT